MSDATDVRVYERAIKRERDARKAAERLLEKKSRELYEKNRELLRSNEHLEEEVTRTTANLRQAKEEAESSNESKSKFLAMMSHEMRTPLSAIVGLADLLADIDDVEERRHLCGRIQRNGDSLLRQIEDCLEFARLDAGELSLQYSQCDPLNIIDDLTELYGGLANERELCFAFYPAPELGHRWWTDGTRVRQVLQNLIGNALKYTIAGKVQVMARVQTVLGEAHSRIVFEVRDTGQGISAKDHQLIFERFTRLQRDRDAGIPGTGLGLSIAYQLVQKLGGSIEVESEIGLGACFRVTLPFLKSSPSSDEGNEESSSLDDTRDKELQNFFLQDTEIEFDISDVHLAEWLDKTYRYWGAHIIDASREHEAGIQRHEVTKGNATHRFLVQEHEGNLLVKPFVYVRDLESTTRQDALANTSLETTQGQSMPLPLTRRKLRDSMHQLLKGRKDLATMGEGLGHKNPERTIIVTPEKHSVNAQEEDVERKSVRVLRRVLLAEDDFDNQTMLSIFIKRLGYDVIVANNGAEASTTLKSEPVCALVTDISMPIQDGVALTHWVRREEANGHCFSDGPLPIIGVSANAFAEDQSIALRAGMDAFLAKPVSLTLLEKTFARLLDTSLKVLLVDDSEDIHILFDVMTRDRDDIEVFHAQNESRAYQVVQEHEIEVLFCDYHLGGTRGDLLLKGLRAEGFDGRAHALTGEVGDDAKTELEAAGFESRIVKPFKKESILGLMRRGHNVGDACLQARNTQDFVVSAPLEYELRAIDSELRELVPGYIQKRIGELPMLGAMIQDKDFSGLRLIGHRIKGSGGGYGLKTLSLLADQLERAALAENQAAALESAESMSAYLKECETLVSSLFE